MATTTTATPSRTGTTITTGTVCGCSTEDIELIARAECFLRLEEQSEIQMLAITKRREEEQDKIFKLLCAATELSVAKLGEALKTYDAASVTIEADAAAITRLQKLVGARIDAFALANGEAFCTALEKRRKMLGEQLDREQQDTITVQSRIELVEKRLQECSVKAKASGRGSHGAPQQTAEQHPAKKA